MAYYDSPDLVGFVQRNAMLDVAPLSNAIEGWKKQQQQDIENQRAAEQLGMQRERLGMEKTRFSDERLDKAKQAAGNLALLKLQYPDKYGDGHWKGFMDTHLTELRKRDPNATLDPAYYDPALGPMKVLADSGMAQQFLDYQMRKASDARAAAAEGRAAETHRSQMAQYSHLTPEQRMQVAPTLGLQAGTPGYNTFISSGSYQPDGNKFHVVPEGAGVLRENPKTGESSIVYQGTPKVDSTAKKAIYEAQDELPNLRAAVDNLREAKALLPKVYTGIGSGARTWWNQATPGVLPNIITDPKRAEATQRFNQIMGAEAIGAMSQTLKGATTDREMKEFVNLINDPNTAPPVKAQAIDAMIRKAAAHYKNKADRIRELGGRMPDDGGAGPAPGAAPMGPATDPLGIR